MKSWSRLSALAAVASSLATPAFTQTWTPLSTVPYGIYPGNPILLTDGEVLMQDAENTDWWKLTPDINGSYENGTWTEVASTSPENYGPLYYASQVMPDGRVFTMGGEYNVTNGGSGVWQNTGYIYDPVANTWTFQSAPSGWGNMGDTGSITLPNGQLMLADPYSNQCAIFNPATNTFGAPFVNGKADSNDEEGLVLLPNGNVLTVDTKNTKHPQATEIYNVAAGTWTSFAPPPNQLVDTSSEEIGPGVLRPDGTVVWFGALGQNAIYSTLTGTWAATTAMPIISSQQYDCEDAPAVVLPTGNVLVQASPGVYTSPSAFFEFDGTNFTQVGSTQDASYEPSYVGTFLVLPTGQVLYTGLDGDVELYSPTPVHLPHPAWAPTITSAPSAVKAGLDYEIYGTQFNGLTGASFYGDDDQNETNYPIIRITNNLTHNVFYCREHNPSTMGICTGTRIVSTYFQVPPTIENGPSTIQVVTNGIPSKAVNITVATTPINAMAASVYQGVGQTGFVQNLWALDGSVFTTTSVAGSGGQEAAIEADFTSPSVTLPGLDVVASTAAVNGATGTVYIYNWQTKKFVSVGTAAESASQSEVTFVTPGASSAYIGPNREIRVVVQAFQATGSSPKPFKFVADLIQIVP